MFKLNKFCAIYAVMVAIASSTAALAEVKTGLYVKYLQVSQGGTRAFMQFSTSVDGSVGAYTFSTGCTVNHSAILDTSTADGKNMYALLMSAYVAKLPLEVNAGNCNAGYPRVIEVAYGFYP